VDRLLVSSRTNHSGAVGSVGGTGIGEQAKAAEEARVAQKVKDEAKAAEDSSVIIFCDFIHTDRCPNIILDDYGASFSYF